MKRIVLASAALVVLIALWVALFVTFRSTEQVLFPGGTYQVYPVTDSTVGGFSTVELSQSDSVISARVNIRSGMAYPYAGMGVNLLSIHNRPASGYFDFSDYDSLIIDAETDRMRKIGVKILNDDPVYSQKNDYRSYRPMVSQVLVRKNGVAVSMLDFKVPEWWFAMQGLEKDDGLRYMNRGMLFEITNGEGTMLGIPDEITVRSIKLWGENRTFKALMYVALAVIAAVYAGVVALAVRGSERSVKKRVEKEENLKSRMASAAKLLRESDRSVAEIAIAVGAGSPSSFEKDFVRIYGVKPLDYRNQK
ncbi:helix-turn-helix domain-containing protein [Fibrobacter sp.]|uniref:helix-turn-helix domain-containing protein n=1 Tax=Fibrobacter sp. TaxID=35828 RepID=UPI0025E2B960|nr:helix-turn-helix domain-containing protein [Fibrobacter sp.]MDD7498153.1 helix-turn-helix domain-containing protein [Fibrobacter sp.]MDY5725049.1 helix-turn-helix domain-containing protein [Fibrobacter sp.]